MIKHVGLSIATIIAFIFLHIFWWYVVISAIVFVSCFIAVTIDIINYKESMLSRNDIFDFSILSVMWPSYFWYMVVKNQF